MERLRDNDSDIKELTPIDYEVEVILKWSWTKIQPLQMNDNLDLEENLLFIF